MSLLTGRDFVFLMYVALNGAEDIGGDGTEDRLARKDANRKAARKDGLEYEEHVFNYRRICNPELPLFLNDESGSKDAATPGRRAKTQADPQVAQRHRGMRSTARRNVEKQVARNKPYYDKTWSQAREKVKEGAQRSRRRHE